MNPFSSSGNSSKNKVTTSSYQSKYSNSRSRNKVPRITPNVITEGPVASRVQAFSKDQPSKQVWYFDHASSTWISKPVPNTSTSIASSSNKYAASFNQNSSSEGGFTKKEARLDSSSAEVFYPDTSIEQTNTTFNSKSTGVPSKSSLAASSKKTAFSGDSKKTVLSSSCEEGDNLSSSTSYQEDHASTTKDTSLEENNSSSGANNSNPDLFDLLIIASPPDSDTNSSDEKNPRAKNISGRRISPRKHASSYTYDSSLPGKFAADRKRFSLPTPGFHRVHSSSSCESSDGEQIELAPLSPTKLLGTYKPPNILSGIFGFSGTGGPAKMWGASKDDATSQTSPLEGASKISPHDHEHMYLQSISNNTMNTSHIDDEDQFSPLIPKDDGNQEGDHNGAKFSKARRSGNRKSNDTRKSTEASKEQYTHHIHHHHHHQTTANNVHRHDQDLEITVEPINDLFSAQRIIKQYLDKLDTGEKRLRSHIEAMKHAKRNDDENRINAAAGDTWDKCVVIINSLTGILKMLRTLQADAKSIGLDEVGVAGIVMDTTPASMSMLNNILMYSSVNLQQKMTAVMEARQDMVNSVDTRTKLFLKTVSPQMTQNDLDETVSKLKGCDSSAKGQMIKYAIQNSDSQHDEVSIQNYVNNMDMKVSDMQKLEKGVTELAEIFTFMTVILEDASQTLDSLEDRVHNAQEYTGQALRKISHAEKTFENYEANKAAVQKYVFCGWFQELCQNKWCMLSMLICFVCAILMFLHQCGIDVLPMLCGCDDERSIKVDVKK